ncbi:MAG: hypothetical protein HC927_02980 [Deltaproteobacteria bacterium]|nr:hypothetical protein [Deltaproteobacteria bacterium]
MGGPRLHAHGYRQRSEPDQRRANRGLRGENWPPGSLRSDRAWELAAYDGSEGAYQTAALRVELDAAGDPGPRTLAWNVEPFDLQDAIAFSFRASNIDAVNYPTQGQGCSPADGDPTDEIDFDVVFVSLSGEEVSVAVSDYTRLVAPDIFEVINALTLTPDMCPVSHFLQTVRIPLAEVLCAAFPPGRLREVRLVFDVGDGPKGRAVLLDTIEFHRDGSGQSACGS